LLEEITHMQEVQYKPVCGTPLTHTVSSNPMDMSEILHCHTKLNELVMEWDYRQYGFASSDLWMHDKGATP